MQTRMTEDDKIVLLRKYSCFIFDCDGTLWKGMHLIEGASETLDMLRRMGKRVLFVTNNSTKSRATYAKKFDQLGVAAHLDEIYCSSYSAAAYLKASGFRKKAYVVGERGIMDELTQAGIPNFGGPDHNGIKGDFTKDIEWDREVGAVVCGVDPGLSYYKVQYASLCLLQNPGCEFIATNTDARGHFTANQEWAGAGATVGAIKGVVERDPVVTGKPSPVLLHEIEAEHNVRREEMCIVGDRLNTDIQWGAENGIATLLVLTGVTTAEMLLAASNNIRPTYCTESLADLLTVRNAKDLV